MSAENEKKVTDYCHSLEEANLAKSVQHLSEDVDYQNIGTSQSTGHAGVQEMLGEWIDAGMLQKMDIKHTASSGNIVMNVRLETWALGDVTIHLPCMGMFEVNSEGKICRWHDYWDRGVLEPLMAEMKRVRGRESLFDEHMARQA
ncbi:MAG: nuclear transport factor 2 family protein [Acidobacteria bacterium]|nr:nuclear transport factor 2 family protein [Acidobacteriota bacterium]